MNTNVLMGICAVLGLLGVWNTWTLYQIDLRIDTLEKKESVQPSTKEAKMGGTKNLDSYKHTAEKALSLKASSKRVHHEKDDIPSPTIDLTDPEIQEAIAKIAETNAQKKEELRRTSKMEAYKVSVKHELETFSQEKGYDESIVQSIATILDESTSEWTSIRAQVREGEISWMDARAEFKAIGDETEERVTEVISPEDYKELRARLWGDWGR